MWSSYSPSLPYPPSIYGPRALHVKCVYASGGWQPLSTNIFINHTFFFNLLRQSAFPFLLELLFPAPGVLFVESRNWGREWDVLLYRVIAIRKRRNIQNAVFCEVNFGKESRLICLCHIKRCRSFSGQDETVFEWFCLKAWEISRFMLVLTREQTIVVNRAPKMRQATCNWTEDTQRGRELE